MARFKATVTSYEDARQFWESNKNPEIAYNTRIGKLVLPNTEEEVFALIYHTSVVVVWYEDRRVMLNTEGWQTLTTKQRIQESLPPGFSIWQKNHEWFVGGPGGRTHKYRDGMVLNPETGEISYETERRVPKR